jgi:hypothetical protein
VQGARTTIDEIATFFHIHQLRRPVDFIFILALIIPQQQPLQPPPPKQQQQQQPFTRTFIPLPAWR